jgi:hypothetical protein
MEVTGMKNKLILGVYLLAAVTTAPSASNAAAAEFALPEGPTYLATDLPTSGEDSDHPGTMWAGSGIPTTNFVLRDYPNGGINLAIKGHYRQGADIVPTFVDDAGVIHVEVPAGHQVADPDHGVPGDRTDLARWNFAYSVDVSRKAGAELTSFKGELWIDIDPTEKAKYYKLRLGQVSVLDGDQASGFGWAKQGVFIIGDDEGNANVTQNSQNLAFYDALIDADPSTPEMDSYVAADFPPGIFDVILKLERRRNGKADEIHVVFNVVDMD